MYSLKPILVDQKIDLPGCMFPMKQVNADLNANMSESKNNSDKSEIELMEENQNRVLKKLDELRQTLLSMRGELNVCNKPAQKQKSAAAVGVKKPIDVSNLSEVVVNAHPSNVPFSILAFKTQWSGRLNLLAEVFTHSSVKESDFSPAAKEFAQKVSAPIAQNSLPTLKVTIIWKDVEVTQMLTSASKFIPIYGEVNIIRFLNRVGPSEFYYEADNHFATLSDGTLDICHQLSKKQSIKERQFFVQQLNAQLGKNQFFNDAQTLNVGDVAVSSILKRIFGGNLKEMPANLSSWLQKVSKIAGY